MALYGIFNEYGRCSLIAEEQLDGMIKLPKGANPLAWAGRIVLDADGKPVIKYDGLSDAEAIELANEEDAEKETARREELVAKKAAVSKQLTRLEFLNRFTVEERVALRVKEQNDPIVADLFDMIRVAEYVDTKNQSTIDGISYLAAKDYITPERAVEILK